MGEIFKKLLIILLIGALGGICYVGYNLLTTSTDTSIAKPVVNEVEEAPKTENTTRKIEKSNTSKNETGNSLANLVNNEKTTNNKGHVIRSGYVNDDNIPNKVLVESMEDLKEFCNNYTNYTYDGQGNIISGSLDSLLEDYDEEFFEDKSLACVYVVESSGGIKVNYLGSEIEDDTVSIEYEEDIPKGMMTQDMNGYIVYVEVPKEVKKIEIK